ncbi:MAG: PfkB family carbohydrate kinase [Spirochaetota bacterium]
MAEYVTFGEIMLRLKPPGHQRLLQQPLLEATFGGGEANVACGLAGFGLEAAFVTVVPPGPVGDACLAELRRRNVHTEHVRRGGQRLGIYFLEQGANQRPSVVLYDRSHSAIAEAPAGIFDWTGIFRGARWFHVTGITPAISRSAAELAMEAVRAAKQAGLTVSCDLNYRKKLWNWGSTPPEVMGPLVSQVDLAVGNEEDCQVSLGISAEMDVESGKLPIEGYRRLTGQVLEAYPNLQKIALTLRESFSADYNAWSAVLHTRDEFMVSRRYEIRDIVDRVGAGDCFAAGLIYGLSRLDGDREALEFAAAASCLMHSISGDLPLLSVEEVARLAGGSGTGRVQR